MNGRSKWALLALKEQGACVIAAGVRKAASFSSQAWSASVSAAETRLHGVSKKQAMAPRSEPKARVVLRQVVIRAAIIPTDANRRVQLASESVQTVYEYDVFFTSPDNRTKDGSICSELYFVLCVFGCEFVINMGGPDTDGYEEWLRRNGNMSPLYLGKNARIF